MKFLLTTVAVVLALPWGALGAERGPSTSEERQKVVTLVRHLEEDPLSSDSKQERQWMLKWLTEVPDIDVTVCMDFYPGLLESKGKQKTALVMQPGFSTAAFVIEHPDKASDEKAKQLAGLQGMLRAYEAVLRKDPTERVAALDELLAKREAGKLEAFVEDTLPKCSAR